MPKALLSVYNKTGLVTLAGGLVDLGWELLASGGTAKLLQQNGLPVTEVSAYTGSPEILGGRVKTLHPAIHGGILARDTQADQDQMAELHWSMLDLVVVNLYPFEDTIAKPDVSLAEAIEQIDIGGVALIRAAAKNHARVTLLCDPADYTKVLTALQAGEVDAELRAALAVKGFQTTAHYDQVISAYLSGSQAETLTLYPGQPLRYGENPHQQAALLTYQPGDGPLGGKVLHGKALSYNNLLDLDAAWRAAASFEQNTVVIVKHLSPCGIASAEDQLAAYQAALASDPVSAFGGVIAVNRPLTAAAAEEMHKLFVECIAAPGFSPEALEILEKKKNIRLLEMPDTVIEPPYEYRSIVRGLLKQSVDFGDLADADWKVATDRQPSSAEMESLRFAWKACQHVKSNSIVFAKDQATVGIGGGQPNRVDCVRIAGQRAGEQSVGAVMASDAYFPFPDSVEEAARLGICAIIQPGGSVRDQESIDACNRAGMAMVFTGFRHFRH